MNGWVETYIVVLGILGLITTVVVIATARHIMVDNKTKAKIIPEQSTVLDFDTRRLRQQASEEYRRQAMDELGIVETGTQYSAEYTGGNINYVPTEERMVYYGRWTPNRGEDQ